MRKVILVTSVIYPDENKRLQSGSIRSRFLPSERLCQTVGTLHSLTVQQPDAQMFFCDASIPDYAEFFANFFPAVRYLRLNKVNPGLAKRVRGCENKTVGECQMLLALWHAFGKEIAEADFVLKATGRYMYENLNDKYFVPENLNSYLFQAELPSDVRDWVDARGFSWTLARSTEYPSAKRHILRTILYGFGRFKTLRFFDALMEILFRLDQPSYVLYDIENMLPFVLAKDIASKELKRTDWLCLGWNGLTGDFIRQ